MIIRTCLLSLLVSVSVQSAETPGDWAGNLQIPKGENVTRLFDGQTLSGWEGQKQYWSVHEGAIRGTNDKSIPTSSYLFTKNNYRNFRLLLEVKQTRGPQFSDMHSAVAALGEKMEDKGDPFSFKGPLLMFCNDWGIWDANRRNRIYPPKHPGQYHPPVEKTGEWNQIEVLVIGDRVRMVANGKLVIDFTDKPGMLKDSPIGLQLHSNNRPQEYHFRGLMVSENPRDELVTLVKTEP